MRVLAYQLYRLMLNQCPISYSHRHTHYRLIQDPRFQKSDWEKPPFFIIQQAYLQIFKCCNRLIKRAPTTIEQHHRIRFIVHLIMNALSPSNLWFVNPEIIQTTWKKRGHNLWMGLNYLQQDVATWHGYINFCKGEPTDVGKKIATTNGSVVYRNELMELIAYNTTASSYTKPLLLVPSWINKYYLFDLTPRQSLVKWLSNQGYQVFVISWANPSRELHDKSVKDYITQGIISALDHIYQATQAKAINTAGHCLGGTLLLCAASILKHKVKPYSIQSMTLLASIADFANAGTLSAMMGPKQRLFYRKLRQGQSFWNARQLALAFNLLDPNAFIWPYWINRYAKGKKSVNLPILTWTSDMMHCTLPMYQFYSESLYGDNQLTKGTLTIDGQIISLTDCTMPTYILALTEDHISPYQQVNNTVKQLPNVQAFIASQGGHFTGIINPPTPGKYYQILNRHGHIIKQGRGWWQHWQQWLKIHSGNLESLEIQGDRQPLQNAPGQYIHQSIHDDQAA